MFHVKEEQCLKLEILTPQCNLFFLKSVFLRRCLTVTVNQCDWRSWLVNHVLLYLKLTSWSHEQSSELPKAQATVEWHWGRESKSKHLLLFAVKVSQSRRRLAGYVFYPVVVEATPLFVRAHATCGGQSIINLHTSSMHNHSPNTAAVLSHRSSSIPCCDTLSSCCLTDTLWGIRAVCVNSFLIEQDVKYRWGICKWMMLLS